MSDRWRSMERLIRRGEVARALTTTGPIRTVPTTRAPRAARARMLSCPMPDAQPVTRTVRPDRSRPSRTWSAVVREPKRGMQGIETTAPDDNLPQGA